MQFFVILQGEQWHWELRRVRGEVVATSAHGYRTQEDALEAIHLIRKSCDAFMYDVSGNMLESRAVTRVRPVVVK
jgi:uncharacterized protein YegP (UPF0339 family)